MKRRPPSESVPMAGDIYVHVIIVGTSVVSINSFAHGLLIRRQVATVASIASDTPIGQTVPILPPGEFPGRAIETQFLPVRRRAL